jgi:hypothetical protein
MKYLVTVRRRDGVPAPPEAIAGMLHAQHDWLQEKLDEGTFDIAYTFAQGGGGIGIVNAETGDELNEIITSSPLFGISQIEVQPLAGLGAIDNAATALSRGASVTA